MLFLFYPFYHRLLKLSSSFLSFQIAIIKRTITIEESFEVGLDDGQDTSDDDFKKEDWEIPSGQNSLGICIRGFFFKCISEFFFIIINFEVSFLVKKEQIDSFFIRSPCIVICSVIYKR